MPPDPPRIRLLRGATALVGVLLLAAAPGALLWGAPEVLSSRSDHFGLSALLPVAVIVFRLPVAVVLAIAGALYCRAALRTAASPEDRILGLQLFGGLSLVIAVVTIVTVIAGTWQTSMLDAWPPLTASLVVFGLHAALTGAYTRPASPRREAVWLLSGAATLTLGLILIHAAFTAFEAPSNTSVAVTRVVDPAVPRPPRPPPPPPVRALALSPDATHLVTARDRWLAVYHVPTDRTVWSDHLEGRSDDDPPALALSPNNSRLLYADESTFALISAGSGDVLHEFTCDPPGREQYDRPGVSAAFVRDGARAVFAATSRDQGTLCFVDLNTREITATVQRACRSLSASVHGDRVWARCDGALVALDPLTGDELQSLAADPPTFAVFPDGRRILALTAASTLQVLAVDGEHTTEFPLDRPAEAIVGPLRDGAVWLLQGPSGLFEVDLATPSAARVLCTADEYAAMLGHPSERPGITCLARKISVRP